jgi:hypothetical protein
MRQPLPRRPRKFTVDEYFASDLPEKVELIDGEIGPYSDDARYALLSNWGTDAIIDLIGADAWQSAIDAYRKTRT